VNHRKRGGRLEKARSSTAMPSGGRYRRTSRGAGDEHSLPLLRGYLKWQRADRVNESPYQSNVHTVDSDALPGVIGEP
jgi:hypothetical protein